MSGISILKYKNLYQVNNFLYDNYAVVLWKLLILKKLFFKIFSKISLMSNKMWLNPNLTSTAYLIFVLKILKKSFFFQYKTLGDIICIDRPAKINRFQLFYYLININWSAKLFLSFAVQELVKIPTTVHIYSSAAWSEREVWDLYGIYFQNHPDLRRILTDYGFEGHPLRKDFPVTGFSEIYYDNNKKRIVYDKVSLTQEYRLFEFLSPWHKRN